MFKSAAPSPAISSAANLIARDRAHLWHPYASTVTQAPLYVVREAAGTRLVLDDGQETYDVVDGMASWWCAIHGYRHPALDAALAEQVSRFSHVMFGGLTHEGAVALADKLVGLTPPGLDRVFLADSGSVAVEVALKIARQLQLGRAVAGSIGGSSPARGAKRVRVAALRGGYHGDTLGAMSVCDPDGGMHAAFAGSVPGQVFLPRPPAWAAASLTASRAAGTDPRSPGVADRPNEKAAATAAWIEQAEAVIHRHRDELAAIIVEPLLQGAGGMWAWAPAALRALRDIADRYELLLIADEIATGFGRTGRLFACDWAGVIPDVLVVGKALTGGYLTQAAVVVREEIAAEIGHGAFGALMHGPTFMGNPLACAVSLASLSLLESGGYRDDVARCERVLRQELAGIAAGAGATGRAGGSDSPVADVRVLGATATIALAPHVPLDVSIATRAALEHGVWLRPFRNLVYAMPPYLADEADLRTIAAGMSAAVRALQDAA